MEEGRRRKRGWWTPNLPPSESGVLLLIREQAELPETLMLQRGILMPSFPELGRKSEVRKILKVGIFLDLIYLFSHEGRRWGSREGGIQAPVIDMSLL